MLIHDEDANFEFNPLITEGGDDKDMFTFTKAVELASGRDDGPL
jgi:hypothetical protein